LIKNGVKETGEKNGGKAVLKLFPLFFFPFRFSRPDQTGNDCVTTGSGKGIAIFFKEACGSGSIAAFYLECRRTALRDVTMQLLRAFRGQEI